MAGVGWTRNLGGADYKFTNIFTGEVLTSKKSEWRPPAGVFKRLSLLNNGKTPKVARYDTSLL